MQGDDRLGILNLPACEHLLGFFEGNPAKREVFIRVHGTGMEDGRGITRFKEIETFRTDAWRGIKGIKQPERAAAHAAFFFELTAGTAFRRFACFQFAGGDLQQLFAGTMTILSDEQDLFILDKQDGRTARMTDEIALCHGAIVQDEAIGI